jgi:hypothetical protein
MNHHARPGGWPRGPHPRSRWSGTPESRPQLEELRSGEWVTEPAARVRPVGTGPARLSLVRS